MKGLHMVSWVLLVIGGLNWGLEVFGWGIGHFLPSGLTTVIYALVGISALVEIFSHKRNCKCCEGMCEPKAPTQQM
jgi:uncharacterized membrane protein YuzA (DUF378 family)